MLRVAADLSAPGVGDGLSRLEHARPDTLPSKAALKGLAEGGDWRTADADAARARSSQLAAMARSVLRPQPVRGAEGEPTAAAPRAAARQRPPEAASTAAGEKAATTPSGKRRKAAAAAAGKSESTGKTDGDGQ